MSIPFPTPFLHRLIRCFAALFAAGLLVGAAPPADAAGARVSVWASNTDGTLYGGGAGFRDVLLERSGPPGNEAKAHAALADGALHVFVTTPAQSQACWLHLPFSCVPSNGSAAADLWDVVTLHASDLGESRTVPWTFAISGIEDDGPWRGVGSNAEAKLAFHFATTPEPGLITYREVRPGDVFAGAFELPDGPDASLTLYFHAGMTVSAWNGGVADYWHTGRFSWQLPAGVTVHSDSGVFMADHLPPPVPEPATAMLALLGLPLLIAGRRRAARAG